MSFGRLLFATEDYLHAGALVEIVEHHGLESSWVPGRAYMPADSEVTLPPVRTRLLGPLIALTVAAARAGKFGLSTAATLTASYDLIILAKRIAPVGTLRESACS